MKSVVIILVALLAGSYGENIYSSSDIYSFYVSFPCSILATRTNDRDTDQLLPRTDGLLTREFSNF